MIDEKVVVLFVRIISGALLIVVLCVYYVLRMNTLPKCIRYRDEGDAFI